MPTWYVQEKEEVELLDEERLRKRLRKGRYTGAERVRLEGSTEWRHLYEVPLFAEELPNSGDPLEAARSRLKRSFVRHALTFFVVVGYLSLQHGLPSWSLWWALALVIHGVDTGMRLQELGGLPEFIKRALSAQEPTAIGATPPPTSTADPAPAAEPPAPAATRPMSPWRTSVEASLNAIELRAAASGHADALPDTAALRETADELDQGATELGAAVNPEGLARLELDLSEAETAARGAIDARTAEAHQRAAAAIRERLSQADALRDTLQRIQARQAALLHQLEALRLTLATTQLSGSGAELDDELRQLRDSQRASDEVERELAVARQRVAASRQRT